MFVSKIDCDGVSTRQEKCREVYRSFFTLSDNLYRSFQSSDGSTPVHLASSYGYMDILDILMKAVAFVLDPPPDQDGMLPIHKWESSITLTRSSSFSNAIFYSSSHLTSSSSSSSTFPILLLVSFSPFLYIFLLLFLCCLLLLRFPPSTSSFLSVFSSF